MNDEKASFVAPSETSVSPKAYQSTMPKLDLEQNTRVFIRLNPLSQQSQPLQGEFLGVSHYDFIILRLPSVSGLLNKLLPQTRVEIRYMQEGAVHTFTTEVISYTVKPTLLLFASYPDRMSVMDTRRHHRVMCALPILMHSPKGDGEGLICDLSLGGCRVGLELSGQSSMRELMVGDNIVIQTVFSADGQPCGTNAVIRNVEFIGTQVTAGISFTDKKSDFIDPLTRYIKMVKMMG